jgi:RecA/RadA recombinase
MQERKRRRSPVAEQVENLDRDTEIESESIVGPNISEISADRLIPSGSTLLNCACSDNPFGAFAMGSINTIPGESSAGKSFLMLTILACCASDERFDDYILINDDSEFAMSFDIKYLFPPLVDRMKAPKYNKDGEPMNSNTVQDFQNNILKLCSDGKPFIYVEDSLDALSSNEEIEREYSAAIKAAKSDEAVKEIMKGYKTEKARYITQVLRLINGKIKETKSVVFITQQLKQNMKPGYGAPEWVTSGGNAPYFYSFHRIYLNSGGSITDEYKGIKNKIGHRTRAQVIKNKLNGHKRNIEFDVYDDLGIDDVASCIAFLKKTGHWKSDSGGLNASEFNVKFSLKDMIRYIERKKLQTSLQEIVGKMWDEIEQNMRLTDRARRF